MVYLSKKEENKMSKYLLTGLLVVGCGAEINTEREEKCSVNQSLEGIVISCPDGSEAIINDGKDGNDGTNGVDGIDGSDGSDGSDGVDGTDGRDGRDGQDGIDGRDGKDGKDNMAEGMKYEGYYCSRVVVSVDDVFYINHGQLVPLTSSWFEVSTSCDVRVTEGKVVTR